MRSTTAIISISVKPAARGARPFRVHGRPGRPGGSPARARAGISPSPSSAPAPRFVASRPAPSPPLPRSTARDPPRRLAKLVRETSCSVESSSQRTCTVNSSSGGAPGAPGARVALRGLRAGGRHRCAMPSGGELQRGHLVRRPHELIVVRVLPLPLADRGGVPIASTDSIWRVPRPRASTPGAAGWRRPRSRALHRGPRERGVRRGRAPRRPRAPRSA